MGPVKKILAPTDLSRLSVAGLRYAFDLARGFDAEVTVYHVVNRDEIMQYSEHFRNLPGVEHTPNLLEEYQVTLSRFLKENLSDLSPLGDIHKKVDIGLPYKSIVETARIERMDLIVMSTHGRTGLSHLLLGSVTEKVVRTAPCPVVSIHPDQDSHNRESR